MTAMKPLFKSIGIGAVTMAFGLSVASCVSENPFIPEAESGNATLQLSTAIRGEVHVSTRDENSLPNQAELESNLVVYVERTKSADDAELGLIRKYIGLHTLPGSLSLSAGEYVVEGWTGDSVSASWDKKFYRGFETVELKSGDTNSVQLHCNIANVIISVDPASLEAGLSNINLSFWHSRQGTDGENVMNFTEEEINAGAKAYFMMPTADHTTGAKETVINYTVTGTYGDGSEFKKDGQINGVKSAHEYNVKVLADQSNSTLGGALIQLEIADIPVIEEKIEVFPAPTYEVLYGTDVIDPSAQIDLTTGDIYNIYLTAVAFKGVKDVRILFSDNLKINNGGTVESLESVNDISLYNNEEKRNEIDSRYGIKYKRVPTSDKLKYTENDTIAVDEVTVTIPETFLKSIVPDAQEQKIIIMVNDGFHNTSYATLRFATTESALDAPVGTADPTKIQDNLAISPYSATLYGVVYNQDRAQNYGIRYREIGASDWIDVPASSSRADAVNFSVKATNLKPGTKYEYKAYCDGFEEQKPRTFTTEELFVIPNASFEEWSTYSASTLLGTKKVNLPGNTGDKMTSFWGSGNEGAATADLVLTSKSADMQHSGGSSARLASNSAMGFIAAGNIFTGYYVETDGTNGVLSVGRQYNGSHPTKMRLYANYRPGGGVAVKSGNDKFVPEGFSGGSDHGQIYVALTTAPIEIRTNPKKRKLFNKDDEEVVAYGQVTWTESFGPDGALELVEIPLEYKDNAKTVKPTHLVVVASASKYGDYFSGSPSSVLYLDDFELVYE